MHQHRSVLYVNEVTDEQSRFVRFYRETNGHPVDVQSEVVMKRHVWDDLGKPDYITITVEPGDKLYTEKGRTHINQTSSKD